jgi:hypothetical protein
LQTDFYADTVLYDRNPSSFSITDKLVISGGNLGSVPGRFFSGISGIKTDAVIKYQISGQNDSNYNRISSVSSSGTSISLVSVGVAITGICTNTVNNGESLFSLKEPKIINLASSGLYANLPKTNISSVDLSQSELTITKQITGKSTNSLGSLNNYNI